MAIALTPGMSAAELEITDQQGPASQAGGFPSSTPIADGQSLPSVRFVADTMITTGTDHHVREHSPLFAAMLNLKTMSLPCANLPDEVLANAARADGLPREPGAQALRTHGLPPQPIGIRPTDRALMACNFEPDNMRFRVLFALTLAGPYEGLTGADNLCRVKLQLHGAFSRQPCHTWPR